MGQHGVVVDQRPQVVVVEQGDLVDLVRRAEPVEEVQERHPGPQRGGVGDGGEVVRLLHAAGGEHRPAGGAGVHHVAVVAEDRQGVRGDRAGGDVDRARRQLAGDLEHVRHHQQQALRRGERRGQARPAAAAPWSVPAAPASDCISTTSGTAPHRFGRPAAAHSSASSPIGDAGVIG